MEIYRRTLRTSDGEEIIADLSRYVKRLDVAHRGGAALVVLRITEMMMTKDGPQPVQLRGVSAGGGRIPHA